ncbi:MAG: hypothetical protein IPO35_14135 [Uliginosibacterium sp.]|nr:hypothetical protein [Uliginosibacterium sp.]MBK9616579.1 hypothetical protein [Uliginosibacterium sp.]
MPCSRQRKLWIVLGLAVLAYPIYLVVSVIAAGNLGEHCTRPSGRGGVGAFCSWGEQLGTTLFGPAHAHLGYALLVALATALLACFGYLAVTSADTPLDNA